MRLRRTLAAVLCAAVFTVATDARAEGLNNLYAGINGLAVFWMDPILFTIEPPDNFEELPGAVVTRRVVGFLAGCMMAPYRLLVALFDILLSPFQVFPTYSPAPKLGLELIPDVEYEYT